MKNKVNNNKMNNKFTKEQIDDLRDDDLQSEQKHLYWKDVLSKYPTFDNAYDYMNDILSYTDENGVVRERPSSSEKQRKIIRKYMLESYCKQYNIGK